MKFKKTLVLAAVFALLFGYLYYYEMPKQENLRNEYYAEREILSFDKDKLKSFKFTMEHKDIVFQKAEDGAGFIIKEPVETEADNAVIDKFFSELNKAKYKTAIESSEGESFNLKDFRLNIPFYKVTLVFDDDTEKVFKFGDMNTTKDMIYVNRNDDDKIYLFDLEIRNTLDKDLLSFRAKNIFHDDLSDVSKIQIVRKNEELVLEKDGESWFITKPNNYSADIVEVKAFIDNVIRLEAVKFPDQDHEYADRCDFTRPDISVILSSGDNKVIQSFMAINRGPQIEKKLSLEEAEKEECLTTGVDNKTDTAFFKLASKEGVYLIAANDFLLLDKKLSDFRNKPVFKYTIDDIYKLEIKRENKLLTIRRDDKDVWKSVNNKGSGQVFSDTDIRSIFNYLSFVESEAFIDDADMNDEMYGFNSSPLTLTFYDNTGNIIEKLVAGKIEGELVFLKMHNDTTVYMITNKFLERFKL